MSLPTRFIEIHQDEERALEEDIWSNEYVKAYLWNSGMREIVKLRYRGGHTREYPKRSYDILHGTQMFHLNAEYDDPSMIRNALSFQFFEWIGVPCPQTKHCRLVINGVNRGVYLEIEAVNRQFFAKRGIPMESLVFAVNNHANFSLFHYKTGKRKQSLFKGYELEIGKEADGRKLSRFVYKLNTLKGKELLSFLSRQVDIENYLRWLAGAVFTGNYDGFDQNYALYRHKTRNMYRIIPWDYEGTWGRNCYGKQVESSLVRVTGYNQLTKKLLQFGSLRSRYKEILREILKETFTVSKISPVIYKMYRQISPYIYADYGRKWPLYVYENEPLVIQNYIQERRKLISRAILKL
ncbi:CotH kinase family protein [Paenibacillus sp. MSJ-34]|uniref:CotH kinase family protein n=1 Tax=Paenibacillus sp. MSJ-34 TaxID=2841529 RepID=UPI001C124688|nr:CotH kinase family protein [Paenibacillus sp. MSJ-34]MBU5441420.1 CotH kinase family protein [Paenibacillus sp. MSJ-34]